VEAADMKNSVTVTIRVHVGDEVKFGLSGRWWTVERIEGGVLRCVTERVLGLRDVRVSPSKVLAVRSR